MTALEDPTAQLLLILADKLEEQRERFQREAVQQHRNGQPFLVAYRQGARDLAQVWRDELQALALVEPSQRGAAAGHLVIVTANDLKETA